MSTTKIISKSKSQYKARENEIEILPLLLDSLFKKFSGARGGLHVSDLVTCTLKAYYGKKTPSEPTIKQLNYFSSGNGIHDAIQSLTNQDPIRFRKEKAVQYKDVVGHVDIYDTVNRVPIEIKSMRVASSDSPMDYHIAQLKCYMAILDCDYGLLLYQLLLHKDEKPFVEYVIRSTRRERSKILKMLSDRSDMLKKALSDEDPYDLPHIGLNANYEWMCMSCSFFEPCLIQRYQHLPEILGLVPKGTRPAMDAPE